MYQLKVKSSFGSGTWYAAGTPVTVEYLDSREVFAFGKINQKPVKIATCFLKKKESEDNDSSL